MSYKRSYACLIAAVLVGSTTAQTLYVPGGTSGIGNNTANGNVGIGTTNPSYLLHVNGQGRANSWIVANPSYAGQLSLGSGANYEPALSSDTNLVLSAGNGANLMHRVGTAEMMRITSAGNMGIGTSAPASKLHVAGENVELSMGRTAVDATAYTRFGMTTGYDTYWATNATYASGAWNYVTTAGWGSKASRIDQGSGNLSFDTVSGGVNPIIWATRLFIANGGNIGIGTTNPGAYKLAVTGTIRAYELVVDTGWSDYVFADDYRLAPLSEVEAHIKAEKHLPGIPTAAEVAERGISVGEMQSKLLAKVEELTLHVIELKKENDALRQEMKTLEAKVK